MIEHKISAVCDSCGRKKNMQPATDQYGRFRYNLPLGWGYGDNGVYTYCPKCFAGFFEVNNDD